MSENNNKVPATTAKEPFAPVLTDDTIEKLKSREAAIRQSGLLDVFEQTLPKIPEQYALKEKDREFVADAFHTAFDMIGGVPRLAMWAHQNPTEFIKLWARMLPEAEKQEARGVQINITGAPVGPSALDITAQVIESEIVDDDDDEDDCE